MSPRKQHAHSRFIRRNFLATAIAAFLTATTLAAAPAVDEQVAERTYGHGDFLKIQEERGHHVALRVAMREFIPADDDRDGPVIALISVAHVGDAAFYEVIDQKLRNYDLVLFEGIGPPGTQPVPVDATDEQRVVHTKKALRFIAAIIESHKQSHNHYPADLDELRENIESLEPIMANWARIALRDGWGDPLIYEVDNEGLAFVLRSVHASDTDRDDADDTEEAAEESATTLRVTSEDAIEPLMPDAANIQKELANALGLAYQLDSLSYGSKNWRPSDMHFAQLAEAFREHNADMSTIEPMTAGASFPARLAQLLLRAIGWLDRISDGAVSDVIKVVMIEMLGDPDIVAHSMKQLGEGFETVILDERNQVVIDDLARVIDEEPEVASIAVLYGAAHMADLSERLRDQLNFRPHGEPVWMTAISVNLAESAMEPRQLEQMRISIRRMLQQQLRLDQ